MNISIINPILRSLNISVPILPGKPSYISISELSEINIVELAQALSDLGHNIEVYTADAFLQYKELQLNNRLTIRTVPARLPIPFHPGLLPFTPGLANSKNLSESDLIQSGEFHQFATFFASRLALKKHIPFIVWQEIYHYWRTPGKFFQRQFEMSAGPSIRHATTKFVLRTKKAEGYLAQVGIKPTAIGPWIPTGINGKAFKPQSATLIPEDFGFPKDFALIILVARLNPTKGVDLAIQAEAILRKRGIKVGLLVRGSGPELERLKILAKQLNVDDSVRFLGPKSRAEMVDLYNSSTLFLLSSRQDLFPFALLEAAGCGLPSVATDVGCVTDFLQDGVNGLLVSPDPQSIALKIENLLLNTELRQIIGKGARKTFLDNFDVLAVAKKFDQLYRSMDE